MIGLEWRLFDTEEYIFSKKHTRFYYENTMQNPKMYT